MLRHFRWFVCLSATAITELFGAIGLWQRNRILSKPFFGDLLLRESTARFHVWAMALQICRHLVYAGFPRWFCRNGAC
jgi:hypothetical protein